MQETRIVIEEDLKLLPEQKLWLDVLCRAIEDITLACQAKHKDDALRWLVFTDDPEEAGSARWVCEILNLDFTKVKRWARQESHAHWGKTVFHKMKQVELF